MLFYVNGRRKRRIRKLAARRDDPTSPLLIAEYKVVLPFGLLWLLPYFWLLFRTELDAGLWKGIFLNFCLSVLAFFATVFLIPVASKYMMKRNLFGYDINKKGLSGGLVKVPESMGLVCGTVYSVVIIFFQLFYITADASPFLPLSSSDFNAALAPICFMLFLGFVDDVLDIPWRVKLFLPSCAAMFLVMAYAGGTTILVPRPFRFILGFTLLDLGWIYKLCIGAAVVFFTNAVNIFAGINGLEAGQTVVIASSILAYNMMQIGSTVGDPQLAHTFSVYLTQPLVGVSLGLLVYNWFPSSVFVGDSFTYFAGMTMAVVSVFGHFSETLFFLMLPQIINFLYSLPQLLHIVPCPRHRLPRFDPQSGLLIGKSDMNLLNMFLRLFGSCSEYHLFIRLMLFQAICCVSAILSQADFSTISAETPKLFQSFLVRLIEIVIAIPQIIICMWCLLMFMFCSERSFLNYSIVFRVLGKWRALQGLSKRLDPMIRNLQTCSHANSK